MYKLNNQEKAILKTIIRNARVDYFRKNKYVFLEESIEEHEICSKETFEHEIMEHYDSEVKIEELENIFTERSMAKVAKVLTYKEKLVLSLYYIEGKKDSEIADILFSTREAIKMKRFRTLKKLRSSIRRK